ncbi:transposase [Micromonospora sp. NPDC047707]|uniref:transposase n=1 Tax=Micromonospora sp. NPDC047707 TaxID=3154498 RepID=UPI00345361BE
MFTSLTVLRDLARRVRFLEAEAAEHEKAIRAIVRSWRPDLLQLTGVGPIVAATVLTAWSHPGRCRNDAAFAMLAAAAPIPASSGKTVRYRLNRSGHRQLNRALHTVVLTRLQRDERTRAYAERRRAQGKPTERSNAASSATSPETSTDASKTHPSHLTRHRSVGRLRRGDPFRPRRAHTARRRSQVARCRGRPRSGLLAARWHLAPPGTARHGTAPGDQRPACARRGTT